MPKSSTIKASARRATKDALDATETRDLLQQYGESNERTQTEEPSADGEIPFDEALQMAKFGKFNVFLIIVSGIIMATSIIETLSISFVLPASECELHFSSTQKGVLSGVGFVGIIASSYVWGFLSDTVGRRAVIVPSLLLAFGCTVLSSFAPEFWSLIFLRFLHGIFISGSSAAIYAYLGEFHTNAERGRAIMLASVIFGIACMLMPLIAWAIINDTWTTAPIPLIGIVYRPWRFFLIAIGMPSLVSALALLPVPESPKFILSMGKQSDAIAVLRWMHAANRGFGNRNGAEMPPIRRICEEAESVALRERRERYAGGGCASVLRSMWSQTAPLFRGVYLRTTLLASAMQFGNYVNTNGMYMWFPDTVNRVVEYTQRNPGTTATVCQILRWSSTAAGASAEAHAAANATAIPALEWMLNGTAGVQTMLREVVATTDDAVVAVPGNCDGGGIENEAFSYTFLLEILYAVGFAVIALVIVHVGKCTILVMLHVIIGLCGIGVIYLGYPILSLYLYMVVLLIGLAIPVLNAATIDGYPTSMRGMAVCLTLMMGRLGGTVGVNMVALLIEDHCEVTFGLAVAVLFACALMSFFIPGIMATEKKLVITVCPEHGDVNVVGSVKEQRS